MTDFREIARAAVRPELPEWPEDPEVPKPPTPGRLPTEALPECLRGHVESVAAALQVPAELPTLLALGCLSAAVAGKVRAKVRSGWSEPVCIYAATILPPGSRKSAAVSHMAKPLREWEAEAMERAAPDVCRAHDEVTVARKRHKAAMEGAAKGDDGSRLELEDARRQLAKAEAAIPPDGRLLVDDVTPEALVARLAAQGGRAAIIEPEGGPLKAFSGRYDSAGGARLEELKKAYGAEPIIVDRVSREPLRVERPALTVAICLQPGVVEDMANANAFRQEGALARFLWCSPPHGIGERVTGWNVPGVDPEARQTYSRTLRTLLEATPPKGMDGDTWELSIDGVALDVLYEWEAELEPQLADAGPMEALRDWAAKAVGQAVRVAVLLELAERASAGEELWRAPVGRDAMERAVRLIRPLSSHAGHLLGTLGMDEDAGLMRYVMLKAREVIRAGEEEGKRATLRDLHRATRGRKGAAKVEDLDRILSELTERGCLRTVPQKVEGPGRRPSPWIELHPALLEPTPPDPSRRNGSDPHPVEEGGEAFLDVLRTGQ